MSSSSPPDAPGPAPTPVRDPAVGVWPVVIVFFGLGFVSANWASRIPAIAAPLHLSPQQLGLDLLGPAVGAVAAMPVTGWVLGRLRPREVVGAAFVPLTVSLPFITVVGRPWQLFVVLLIWGIAVGVVDVGMNVEAVAVGQRLERRTMSRFHAGYSLGGLAGAGAGAASAAAGVSARTQISVLSAAALLAGLLACRRFAPPTPRAGGSGDSGGRWDPTAGREAEGRRLRPSWALAALAAMAFASFLAEGAANDWSALYLHSSLGASSALAALGYTCFAVAMALGRLGGDHLTGRWGPGRLVRASAAAGAAGFGGALLVARPVAAMVGLLLLGAGLSTVVPNVFSRAAADGPAGPSLAVVTLCGYGGMLAGPAAIGALAGVTGLPAALGVVAGLCAVVAVLAGALDDRPSGTAVRPESRAAERP